MVYRPASWAAALVLMMVTQIPAAAQMTDNLPSATRMTIAAMGPNLDREVIQKSFALMRPLQAPREGLAVSMNVAYGADPLQKLDVYRPHDIAGPVPVIVFVHGGGFTGGDKGGLENIPAYFARHGLLGITVNYRLVPQVHWPAQALDLGSAVAWLRENSAHYDGDPNKIVLVGHSSGATAIASYILDQSIDTPRDGVVGGVLISGPYGYNQSTVGPRSRSYYGDEESMIAKEQPRAHVGESKLPLLIVTAEFDPPPLGAESHDLAAALCVSDGKCPLFLSLSGHNHMTEVLGIDTEDDRLGHAIINFVHAVAK